MHGGSTGLHQSNGACVEGGGVYLVVIFKEILVQVVNMFQTLPTPAGVSEAVNASCECILTNSTKLKRHIVPKNAFTH
jgi:hypothetical protein